MLMTSLASTHDLAEKPAAVWILLGALLVVAAVAFPVGFHRAAEVRGGRRYRLAYLPLFVAAAAALAFILATALLL